MRIRTVVLLVLIGTACGLRAPGRVSSDDVADRPASRDGRRIETFVSPLELVAGESAVVTCVVTRDGDTLEDVETTVRVTPDVAVSEEETAWAMTPTASGTYLVQCLTADKAVIDGRGVHVRVLPAPPVILETTLSASMVGAGVPVDVTCAAYDTFGNSIEEARATGLIADAELLVDPPSGAGFKVRGTIAGDYTVACELDTLVDDTPESLTVVPGIPAASNTTVDLVDIGPSDVVSVTCDVYDAYGNLLSDVPTSIVVLADDGAEPSETGLLTTDDTMSATRMGTYYVFCVVPGYAAGDESPEIVSVSFGLPCTWAVTWPDISSCYWQGRQLPLDYVVYDYWGNVVETAVPDLTAVPSTGVVPDGEGGFVFHEEGIFDLSLALAGPFDPACTGLAGDASQPSLAPGSIVIDSTGPQIEITNPLRASALILGGAGDTTVPVDGTAADTLSPVVDLWLLGTDLSPAGTHLVETIAVSQTSRWGTNIIFGEATDACGNRTVVAQAYLRSGAYFSASTVPDAGARAAQGIVAHLNQPVVDDNERSDLDDLASLGEAVLQAQDFNTLLPPGYVLASDPLRSCRSCGAFDAWTDTGYRIMRHPSGSRRINWQGPWILYLTAIDGGMDLGVRLDDFDFPLRFEGRQRTCAGFLGCGDIPINVNGWAGASRVDATGTMTVRLSGGAPNVTVPTLNLNTSGLYLSIDCGILQFICDGITGLVIGLLESQIEAALADTIRNEIPAVVEEALAGFELDTGFDIPPPVDMRLEMSSGLDMIQFSGPAGSGYGQLGLYGQVYPQARGSGIDPGARGAIRKDGALPTFSSNPDDYLFGLGLKDDFFNQILWALWYGGGLDLDEADLAPLLGSMAGVSLTFKAELPPVAMPGRGGNQIEIGLGDVRIDATVDLDALFGGSGGAGVLNVGLYLSSVVGATLSTVDTTDPSGNPITELRVAWEQEPEIYVQVVSIDDPGYQGLMSDIFKQVLELLLPSLLGSVLESFPIPEFDLSGIGGLPPGTVWRLTGTTVDRDGAYFRITGSLQ